MGGLEEALLSERWENFEEIQMQRAMEMSIETQRQHSEATFRERQCQQQDALQKKKQEIHDALNSHSSTPNAKAVTRDKECALCLENPCGARLVPCNHTAMCYACAVLVHKYGSGCPICR